MAKLSKKGKMPDKRPARARYWSSGRLRERKIANIVKSSGLSPLAADELWEAARNGRRMKTF